MTSKQNPAIAATHKLKPCRSCTSIIKGSHCRGLGLQAARIAAIEAASGTNSAAQFFKSGWELVAYKTVS